MNVEERQNQKPGRVPKNSTQGLSTDVRAPGSLELSSKTLIVQKGKLRLRGTWRSYEKTLEELQKDVIFHLLF